MSERPPEDTGRLRPTGPGALTAWTVAGLVLGWLWRRLAEAVGRPVPLVTWTQGLALLFVAAVLGAVAWATYRAVRESRPALEPHRLVNRLVLARACALVGALLAGLYLGYAVSWVGVETELRLERIARALVAAAGGAAMCVSALLLERACRVRSGGEEP